MSRDSIGRLLGVALVVCLVCSVLVSLTAVGLRERQERNKLTEKRRQILQIANLYDPARPVEEQFRQIQTRIVDLEQGRFVTLEDRQALHDRSYPIPVDRDTAGIGTRARHMEIYLVARQGRLQLLILPVYGKGLWSTMYGFVALGPDLTTINGFGFYQHGETPGLGGEVDNPAWRAKWPGKSVYDQDNRLRIEVLKGTVDPRSPESRYQVDGLAGATLTARGVSNLLRFWLGENGYQPLLHQLRSTGGVLP
jgi:Na+-transporting NADH:ubiquinone oxidoreductase subunit C